MSTQVVCYEVVSSYPTRASVAPWKDFPEYTAEELNHFINHFNETVDSIGFG
jgi:tRNA C32,U32 (ribose-2'-O)-methylase TrmJ